MYYGYGYGYDPTIILVLIGAVISAIASMRVKTTFNKYDKIRSVKCRWRCEAYHYDM